MSWIYTAPLYLVTLLVVVLVLVALETGHRMARIAPVDKDQVSTVLAPILAIVGFLLAFAFGMAGDRHAHRRVAGVEEANAVGTFWLRTSLLSEPLRFEMRSRLRRYVGLHIQHREAGIDPDRLAPIEAELSRIQQELWALLDEEAERTSESVEIRLLVPALNDMIDGAGTVLAASKNRVPDSLLLYLFALVVVAGVVIGYRPRDEQRHYVLWSLYLLVLGGVLVILLDMDRPRRGLIQTNMTPYLRLEQSIASGSAHG